MSVYRPSRSPHWHYDFQIDGVRFHGSTGCTGKRDARAVEAEARRRAVEDIKLGRRERLTMNAAAGRYWEEHGRYRRSARDLFGKVGRIVDGIGGGRMLHRLNDADLARFTASRRAEVAPASVNRELAILRALWNRARDVWGVEVGPAPRWRRHFLEEPAGRSRWLSAGEEERLFAALPPDMAPMVGFSLLTGARLATAYRLTWNDIDLKAGTVTLREVKSRRAGETLVLPLSTAARTLLEGVAGHHPIYPFTYVCRVRRPGRQPGERYPYTATNWRRAWRRALDAAGVEDFRWHDLRHTAATRLLGKTDNLRLVQLALGHASITTTTRYAHVGFEDLRAGFEAMSRNSPEDERAAAKDGPKKALN